MLLPDFLIRCADPILQIYEILNIWSVQEIARTISKNGEEIMENGARNIKLMTEWGMPAQAIALGVSRLRAISEEQVRRLIEGAMEQSVGADFDLFHRGGLLADMTPAEYCCGTRFKKLVREWTEMTNGELQDFCKVLPESGDSVFREACDQAFMRTRAGIVDKTRAIISSIDYCADRGVRFVDYSQHRSLEIESAVRTAVTTGINRAAAACTLLECEDAGIHHVVVTSHLGARVSTEDPIANHAGWQGKVYRIDDPDPRLSGPGSYLEDRSGVILHGSVEDYPSLKESTGYPDNPLGLGGYNCRHNFYPFVPGVSVNHMRQFDNEENKRIFEATQKQRAMEKQMRRTRRRMEAQKAAANACQDEEKKKAMEERYRHHKYTLERQYREYAEFSKSFGLAEQMQRTYTARQETLFKRLNG